MPRSPDSPTDGAALEDYRLALRAMGKLVTEGMSWSGNERNRAFLGCRGGRFADMSAVSGLDFSDDGRALAFVDWDHDGDLDVWLGNRSGPRLRLMLNQTMEQGGAGSSVLIRLRGERANRDGVGAKVELMLEDGGEGRLVRTLHAGQSFLSQSSLWLHFGVPRDARVSEVRVAWPGGGVESFSGLSPGGRYLLHEGESLAMPVVIRRRDEPALVVGEQSGPRPKSRKRVVLSTPLPVPGLTHRSLEGDERVLEWGTRPLLLNLWASWCRPCLAELRELGEREAELRAAGVDVLALSVDGLGTDEVGSEEAARALLKKLEWTLPSGFASPELVEKLALLQSHVLQRPEIGALPSSFLIDAKGTLAVFYVGALDVTQLLKDVAQLEATPSARRAAAVPLPGRWLESASARNLEELGQALVGEYPKDAVLYLKAALEQAKQNGVAAAKLAHHHHVLALALGAAGEPSDAVLHHRAALNLNPGLAVARHGLGSALMARGEVAAAIEQYQLALVGRPRAAATHGRLALAFQAHGDLGKAVHHHARALELDPELFESHLGLGAILLGEGEPQRALVHLRQAVAGQSDSAESHYMLGTALQLVGGARAAEGEYQLALSIESDHAGASNNLGQLMKARGELEAAVFHFRQALSKAPEDAGVHHNLGLSLAELGGQDEALLHLSDAVRLAPTSPWPLRSLAWFLATGRDSSPEQVAWAVRLAERASTMTGHRDPRVLDTLAAAYARAGYFERAVKAGRASADLARAAGSEGIAEGSMERLALYLEQRDYRD